MERTIMNNCLVKDCNLKPYNLGFCKRHYGIYKHGSHKPVEEYTWFINHGTYRSRFVDHSNTSHVDLWFQNVNGRY